MSRIENETRLTNHQRMILNAYRTGAKDARIYIAPMAGAYGARQGSAWEQWYQAGFYGLPLPKEITDQGVSA